MLREVGIGSSVVKGTFFGGLKPLIYSPARIRGTPI